jgi:hypothetical protein
MAAAVAAAGLHPDTDTDPRELEAFAERFKQRRIKLGKFCKYYISLFMNYKLDLKFKKKLNFYCLTRLVSTLN